MPGALGTPYLQQDPLVSQRLGPRCEGDGSPQTEQGAPRTERGQQGGWHLSQMLRTQDLHVALSPARIRLSASVTVTAKVPQNMPRVSGPLEPGDEPSCWSARTLQDKSSKEAKGHRLLPGLEVSLCTHILGLGSPPCCPEGHQGAHCLSLDHRAAGGAAGGCCVRVYLWAHACL